MLSANKNFRETSRWDFVSLNISYSDSRDIFSEPGLGGGGGGGVSQSGTDNSPLVRGSRPRPL